MNDPEETALQFLAGLSRKGPLIVAVSGGGDSVALLAALDNACRKDAAVRRPLVAVTVDHGLRANSAAEARQVADFCASRRIPHRIVEWRGDKPSKGLQAAARLARYRLLGEVAADVGAVAVATAHTFDDQAETVAMRAARVGEDGPSRGLAGMAPATLFEQKTWIMRPFLGMGRGALRAWLARRAIPWIDDPSNIDPRFERARVRAAGPSGDLSARIAGYQQARSRRADALAAGLGESAKVHGGFIVSLSAGAKGLPDRLLHDAAATMMTIVGGRAHFPARRTSARLAQFVAARRPGRITAAGAVADLRRGGLFIYRECRGIRPLRIDAGGGGLFDGRYGVDNAGGCAAVELGVGMRGGCTDETCDQAFSEVPAGVVARALAAEPVGLWPDGRGEWAKGLCVTRYLAPFDVFLPLFDFTLANRCAGLFGRPPYVPPPVASSGR